MSNAEYTILADQVALANRLKVVTNGAANAKTPGFKEDLTLVFNRRYRDADNQALIMPLDAKTFTNHTQGSLEETGDKFNFAIVGKGFFGIMEPDGRVLYTRNGKFSASSDGILRDMYGRAVMDADGGPIVFDDGDPLPTISRNGNIFVGNELRGSIGIFAFDQEQVLKKTLHGDFITTAPAVALEVQDKHVLQGMVEGSNFSSIMGLVELSEVSKQIDQNNMVITTKRDNTKAIMRVFGKLD